MINKLKKALVDSQRISVLCHVNSDGDSLGSCMGLCSMLEKLGKDVRCYIEEEVENRLKFIDYSFIVFDENTKVENDDLCIALDCGSIDRLGRRIKIFEGAKATANIDHHRTNTNFADINIVRAEKCATAEILGEIFCELGYKLNKSVAFGLYTGILSDSGCLKYSSTTPETMRLMAGLMEYGIDHAEIARLLFDTYTKEQLKTRGIVMSRIESYFDGKVSLVVTDKKLLEECNLSENDANDFVDIPRMVMGTEIAVELKERGGKIKVSLRSNGDAAVDQIAVSFGGGGHRRAAGATIDAKSIDEAKEWLLEKCRQEIGVRN